MTLTELRYIVAVARVKHFGKAADECFVSQPTLSVGIRKLEDSLGITIFERGRSEVRMTPVGQAIIARAQKALAETEAIKSLALADQHQLRQPIKIASVYTIGQYLFPHLIRQIYSFSPELWVSISQDYHYELIQKLLNKELDLILLPTDVSVKCTENNITKHNITKEEDNNGTASLDNFLKTLNIQELSGQPVLREELYVLTASNNVNTEKKCISTSEIDINKVYLLNKQHCLREHSLAIDEQWYKQKDMVSDNSYNSLESLHDNVMLGSGIAIIPALFGAIHRQNEQVRIIPIKKTDEFVSKEKDQMGPYRTLSLVWRSDFPRMQVIDTVKHALKNIDIIGLSTIS